MTDFAIQQEFEADQLVLNLAHSYGTEAKALGLK